MDDHERSTPAGGRTVKISDVAAAAGVSPATVSRVLNNHGTVGPELAERVRAAAARLRYRPSGPARSLRTRAAAVWGLVVPDIENPFFNSMARAIEDVARTAGYSVVLCNSDEALDKEAHYLQVMEADQVSGLLITPASADDSRLDGFMERGTPVVAIDRRLHQHAVDTVLIDNAGGAEAATHHLIQGGCRRIACITGPRRTTTGHERLAGYQRALTAAGMPVDPTLIWFADFKRDGGHKAATELLELSRRPDGLFVANNLMTVGALHACQEAGATVPDDLAVVGFDDAFWSVLVNPRLTTVAQPTVELGRQAAQLLADRLAGYDGPPREVVLSPTLQVRDSSATPR